MSDSSAFLLFSYGATRSITEVPAFLQRISQGRISPERLAKVRTHYEAFGGKSPLYDATQQWAAALREQLTEPVYEGGLFAEPLVETTWEQMISDGITHVRVGIPTPFGGYRGMYLERLRTLSKRFGKASPTVEVLPPCAESPEFLAVHREALAEIPAGAHILFSAHSLPLSVAEPYATQVRQAAQKLAPEGTLAWQSASGPGWLEPSLSDTLRHLAELGVRRVAVVPLGFLLENMETAYDLDQEAAALAQECGLEFHRLPTLGLHPRLIALYTQKHS